MVLDLCLGLILDPKSLGSLAGSLVGFYWGLEMVVVGSKI